MMMITMMMVMMMVVMMVMMVVVVIMVMMDDDDIGETMKAPKGWLYNIWSPLWVSLPPSAQGG